MKKSLLLCGLLAVFLAGCGSPPNSAQYVDPNGPRTIVSLNQIDIQDFNNAANSMVQDLINSGTLEKAPTQPAVMAISRITNDTTQQFDTDMLTKNIRVALLQTGKVVTTTTFGPNPEDKMAQQAGDMQAFMNGQQAPTRIPYYTLTGKIMINTAKAGDVYQRSYIFDLSLTEVNSGLAVWEDTKTITKQGQKPAVGF
jgi:penicillin-binding protein activator